MRGGRGNLWVSDLKLTVVRWVTENWTKCENTEFGHMQHSFRSVFPHVWLHLLTQLRLKALRQLTRGGSVSALLPEGRWIEKKPPETSALKSSLQRLQCYYLLFQRRFCFQCQCFIFRFHGSPCLFWPRSYSSTCGLLLDVIMTSSTCTCGDCTSCSISFKIWPNIRPGILKRSFWSTIIKPKEIKWLSHSTIWGAGAVR